ncbi:arsenate reductase (glutaredoxin) [Sphingomonas sp.]|uniref:arsenate reductase (glutaredoxin) n=1 Tax=Sphingomonas sp. TaxID=28214 RepID=UPI003CC5C4F1
MNATIWHNPHCSKSRAALRLLREAGADVTVVEYRKTPPSVAELRPLYARAGLTPREGLRAGEPGAAHLAGVDDAAPLKRWWSTRR